MGTYADISIYEFAVLISDFLKGSESCRQQNMSMLGHIVQSTIDSVVKVVCRTFFDKEIVDTHTCLQVRREEISRTRSRNSCLVTYLHMRL